MTSIRLLPSSKQPSYSERMTRIYKICSAGLWREAEDKGLLQGSPDDVRDGFIHFSTATQLAETGARHFAGQTDLVLVCRGRDGPRGRPALRTLTGR